MISAVKTVIETVDPNFSIHQKPADVIVKHLAIEVCLFLAVMGTLILTSDYFIGMAIVFPITFLGAHIIAAIYRSIFTVTYSAEEIRAMLDQTSCVHDHLLLTDINGGMPTSLRKIGLGRQKIYQVGWRGKQHELKYVNFVIEENGQGRTVDANGNDYYFTIPVQSEKINLLELSSLVATTRCSTSKGKECYFENLKRPSSCSSLWLSRYNLCKPPWELDDNQSTIWIDEEGSLAVFIRDGNDLKRIQGYISVQGDQAKFHGKSVSVQKNTRVVEQKRAFGLLGTRNRTVVDSEIKIKVTHGLPILDANGEYSIIASDISAQANPEKDYFEKKTPLDIFYLLVKVATEKEILSESIADGLYKKKSGTTTFFFKSGRELVEVEIAKSTDATPEGVYSYTVSIPELADKVRDDGYKPKEYTNETPQDMYEWIRDQAIREGLIWEQPNENLPTKKK